MLIAVWFTEGCNFPPPHSFFADSLFTTYIYKVSVIRLCRHQLMECMSLKAKLICRRLQQVQCKNKISTSCFTQEINTQNTTWKGRRQWQNNNIHFARSYKHIIIKNRLCQDSMFISIDIGLRFWTSPHHVRAYLYTGYNCSRLCCSLSAGRPSTRRHEAVGEKAMDLQICI